VTALTVATRADLIHHLRVQHGFVDQEDDWETFQRGDGYGFLALLYWPDNDLVELHDNDHLYDYPDRGTPVTGWAHKHKADRCLT
jgi:hypothetical protein